MRIAKIRHKTNRVHSSNRAVRMGKTDSKVNRVSRVSRDSRVDNRADTADSRVSKDSKADKCRMVVSNVNRGSKVNKDSKAVSRADRLVIKLVSKVSRVAVSRVNLVLTGSKADSRDSKVADSKVSRVVVSKDRVVQHLSLGVTPA